MGKGDGRRVENSKLIDANWSRAFGGGKVDEHGPTWTDTTPPACSPPESEAEIIISDYDAYRELQREARIARHLSKVLPLVYAQMGRELESGCWPIQ